MINTKLTRKAMNIAYNAHINQLDKAGVLYISSYPFSRTNGYRNRMYCCSFA